MVLVSSNCQTIGVGEALRQLIPDMQIILAPITSLHQQTDVDNLLYSIRNSRVWVAVNSAEVDELQRVAVPRRLVKIPSIEFDGFDPDSCSIKIRGSNLDFPEMAYHSIIAVCSYLKGRSVEETKAFYCNQMFSKLNFYGRWMQSAEALRMEFSESGFLDLHFREYWSRAKYSGKFMHTFNHPKKLMLEGLAVLIKARLDDSDPQWESKPNIMHDCPEHHWPVYPEIASFLGYSGSLEWRINSTMYSGLDAFLAHSFELYNRYRLNERDFDVRLGDDFKIRVLECV